MSHQIIQHFFCREKTLELWKSNEEKIFPRYPKLRTTILLEISGDKIQWSITSSASDTSLLLNLNSEVEKIVCNLPAILASGWNEAWVIMSEPDCGHVRRMSRVLHHSALDIRSTVIIDTFVFWTRKGKQLDESRIVSCGNSIHTGRAHMCSVYEFVFTLGGYFSSKCRPNTFYFFA